MKNLKKISLVIFDMDGLMFDTERIAADAWKSAGISSGIEIPDHLIQSIVGVNAKKSEEIFMDYFGKSFPYSEIRKIRLEYSTKLIEKEGIPVKKGLHELLDFLSVRKISRAVATSTERQRTAFYLSKGEISDKFDIIICGDEVKNSKPDPDIFLEAARRMGVTPDECIVLEDSENGLMAAYRAGMYPVLIPDIKRPCSEIMKIVYKEFKSLDEVKGLFANS